MNNPSKLNGWTTAMVRTLFESMADAARDPQTKSVIITGADPYYCAGVELSGMLKPAYPSTLRRNLYEMNRTLFDTFLKYPKPIVAAVNGPAIGASVTTATLCDAIVASERATFNTPFARLGIPPEGCSSVHFERLMGQVNAARMLKEGWVPTAKEACDAGLVTACVPHDQLMDEATARAKSIEARSYMGIEGREEEYARVNDRESSDLADAFLSAHFLQAQADFMASKNKLLPSLVFRSLVFTRPLWALTL